jgi:hypothetical protein
MGRHGHASIHVALDDFVTKLKRGHAADSSLALARQTTEVLIHAVAAQQAPTVDGIIEGVRAVSRKLVDAKPLGACLANAAPSAPARPPPSPPRGRARATASTRRRWSAPPRPRRARTKTQNPSRRGRGSSSPVLRGLAIPRRRATPPRHRSGRRIASTRPRPAP